MEEYYWLIIVVAIFLVVFPSFMLIKFKISQNLKKRLINLNASEELSKKINYLINNWAFVNIVVYITKWRQVEKEIKKEQTDS